MNRKEQIEILQKDWQDNPRWSNVKRTYSAEDVVRLRGSVQPECTYAYNGAEKLWNLVNGTAKKGYVNCPYCDERYDTTWKPSENNEES